MTRRKTIPELSDRALSQRLTAETRKLQQMPKATLMGDNSRQIHQIQIVLDLGLELISRLIDPLVPPGPTRSVEKEQQ